MVSKWYEWQTYAAIKNSTGLIPEWHQKTKDAGGGNAACVHRVDGKAKSISVNAATFQGLAV